MAQTHVEHFHLDVFEEFVVYDVVEDLLEGTSWQVFRGCGFAAFGDVGIG